MSNIFSNLHNILIYVLLSIGNISYHFEDNRVLNDILTERRGIMYVSENI
jgi:hypothetical protein